jgi:hypothetical protein
LSWGLKFSGAFGRKWRRRRAAEVIERSAEPAAAGCGEVRVKMEEDDGGGEAVDAVAEQGWQ